MICAIDDEILTANPRPAILPFGVIGVKILACLNLLPIAIVQPHEEFTNLLALSYPAAIMLKFEFRNVLTSAPDTPVPAIRMISNELASVQMSVSLSSQFALSGL